MRVPCHEPLSFTYHVKRHRVGLRNVCATCAACHGPAADKKFDTAIPDADLVQIVLNGKKPEKPPNMPAYGEKGITEEQAKALVAHMKSLKK